MLFVCPGKPPARSNTTLILNLRERWSVRNRAKARACGAEVAAGPTSCQSKHPSHPPNSAHRLSFSLTAPEGWGEHSPPRKSICRTFMVLAVDLCSDPNWSSATLQATSHLSLKALARRQAKPAPFPEAGKPPRVPFPSPFQPTRRLL